MEEKDIEILEQELMEFELMADDYYRSKEFAEYVSQIEKSMDNLNLNL
jgi:hypothetical protein